jgi:osmoprotectant transport system permease protein
MRLVLEHLGLTLASVLLAAFVAIPLGIASTKRVRVRQFALGVAGVVQTIPSLALLAFMIPLLGLGVRAAIAALFLYAMLPILRNTYTGIAEVDGELVDAARGMGMRPGQILTRVQLPLAMRTIMAGIRTSTVISIGVATLAAFIGVGGLGKPITQGLYLNDTGLILLGAVPAALLAIAADVGLGRLELALQPRGLRAG